MLSVAFAKAQIVNIPDANFKAKLLAASPSNTIASTETPVYNANNLLTVSNYHTIDTNGDGEIQVSEAQQIKFLKLENASISNVTGIESFINLEYLNCDFNQLTSLDVSGLGNLKYLICQSNNLTSLSVSNVTNLKEIYCGDNELTNINLSGLTNLYFINCGENMLTSIDVSGLVSLKYLYCYNNQITNILFLGCNNLEKIICYNNQFTNLNVSILPNLKELQCNNNQISSLLVSGLTNLQTLLCDNNLLTTIDLTGCNHLANLSCKDNLLTTIDFSDCNLLSFLTIGNNLITTLDLADNPNLIAFNCAENLLLEYINIKNGGLEMMIESFFYNCPNLKFICADEDQVAAVQQKINDYGYTNCHTNNYCSFTPGGTFYTIQGENIFDDEQNGCDSQDIKFGYLKHNITDGAISGSVISNGLGSYFVPVNAGTHTLTPYFENPSYFNINPVSFSVTFPASPSPHTQNFCITPNGVHNDVEVVIAPIIPARPGFDAVYKLVFKNKGNQPLSGSVVFTFNDDLLDFVSSSPTTSNQQPATLTFDYTNLQPFENRSIVVTLNVNSPTETPAVNNGDVLVFQAVINPVLGDEIPTDNTFVFNQTVVGSYDPNDISCIEGAVVPPSEIGNFLHYLVRFENTGTAPAENIVVKTEIDPNEFDSATLQLLNASHPVYTRITNQKVEFIFENIMLESSGNGGGSGGHGHVLMKIKSKPTLQANDEVSNLAKIYFDYNFPVATNDYETVFQILSSGDFSIDTSIAAYPNPTKNNVTIQAKSNLKTIELFDVQGRLLETQLLNQLETTLNLTEKANGIYFVRITTEQGKKVEKIVKE